MSKLFDGAHGGYRVRVMVRVGVWGRSSAELRQVI